MRIRSFISAALLFGSAISIFAQLPRIDSVPAAGYLVGPGDILSIKVLGEPSFDIEALTVDEDGVIVIPFAQAPIVAKCKTERALQADVAKAWSKYLRNPQVNLRVAKRESRPPVSVLGEVKQAERYNLTRRANLLELVSFSGGETDRSGGIVQVFRTRPPLCSAADDPNIWTATGEGSDVPMRQFSLAELRKGSSGANPEIVPGDIIVVQKAAPIYIIGEVNKPSEFSLPDGGLPLTQAIAMAAGVNRDAKKKDIKIYRLKPGSPQPEIIAVNYEQIMKGTQKDIMLQPRDIVEIGKAPKKFMDYVVEFATGIPNRLPIPF